MGDGIEAVGAALAVGVARIDGIAQNIANASTPGYKRQISYVGLTDADLSADVSRAQWGPSFNARIDTKSGSLMHTGNPLDVAIDGEGFFEVILNGRSLYTRKGSFALDGAGRLTLNGAVVNGVDGELRLGDVVPRIDKEGRIWERDNHVGTIRVMVPDADAGIKTAGGGLYEISGTVQETEAAVRQGFLEASNVTAADEVIEMMEILRHFEMNQRVVKEYTDMLDAGIRSIGEL